VYRSTQDCDTPKWIQVSSTDASGKFKCRPLFGLLGTYIYYYLRKACTKKSTQRPYIEYALCHWYLCGRFVVLVQKNRSACIFCCYCHNVTRITTRTTNHYRRQHLNMLCSSHLIQHWRSNKDHPWGGCGCGLLFRSIEISSILSHLNVQTEHTSTTMSALWNDCHQSFILSELLGTDHMHNIRDLFSKCTNIDISIHALCSDRG